MRYAGKFSYLCANKRANGENLNRNYDENPLILQDDFYRISVGCAFLLIINLSMIFLIFFSGMVDWQSGSF